MTFFMAARLLNTSNNATLFHFFLVFLQVRKNIFYLVPSKHCKYYAEDIYPFAFSAIYMPRTTA